MLLSQIITQYSILPAIYVSNVFHYRKIVFSFSDHFHHRQTSSWRQSYYDEWIHLHFGSIVFPFAILYYKILIRIWGRRINNKFFFWRQWLEDTRWWWRLGNFVKTKNLHTHWKANRFAKNRKWWRLKKLVKPNYNCILITKKVENSSKMHDGLQSKETKQPWDQPKYSVCVLNRAGWSLLPQ